MIDGLASFHGRVEEHYSLKLCLYYLFCFVLWKDLRFFICHLRTYRNFLC